MSHSTVDSPGNHELPSASEMTALDQRAISAGIPALELMERAAEGCLEILLSKYRQYLSHIQPVLILCGPGNNGGDGLALSRLLIQKGFSPATVLTATTRYSVECQHQIQRLQEVRGQLHLFGKASAASDSFTLSSISSEQLDGLIAQSPLIIDALLGNGQKEAARGSVKELAVKVNELRSISSSNIPLIAIDVPTGVASASGECFTPVLSCDETFCIEFIKRGLVQSPARNYTGALSVIPIGIREAAATAKHEACCVKFSLLEEGAPQLTLEARKIASHKKDFGSVLVIGGSRSMPGAPMLSALAALRSGAGLVRVTLGSSWPIALPSPELMALPVGETLSTTSLPLVIPFLDQTDAVVVGPGLGVSEQIAHFLRALFTELKTRQLPVVIDADALNLIAEDSSVDIRNLQSVLTPHPGEAARLLGTKSQEVQRDRYQAAEDLHTRFGGTIVLKGSSTVILSGTGPGSGWVCTRGNPYMATAGSGDVLAGMIGAYLARTKNLAASACQGVFIHACCGDRIIERRKAPLIASDLIDEIPSTIASLEE